MGHGKPNQTNHPGKKPNPSAARRLEVCDRTDEGCRSFQLEPPKDALDGLPPPDSLKVETRIVDRIHTHTESHVSGLPGNKTEVGSTSQPQKTKETLSIPIKKVALLSLGLGSVEAVVDSGSEMTVCHPDVVPPELIAEAEASGVAFF